METVSKFLPLLFIIVVLSTIEVQAQNCGKYSRIFNWFAKSRQANITTKFNREVHRYNWKQAFGDATNSGYLRRQTTRSFNTASTNGYRPQKSVELYRSHGGGAKKLGSSWSDKKPDINSKDHLGLPRQNTSTYYTKARVHPSAIQSVKAADPLGNRAGGGLEYVLKKEALHGINLLGTVKKGK